MPRKKAAASKATVKVDLSPSPAPDRSALRVLQNKVQPVPPNDLVAVAWRIVYGLRKVRARLEEEYATIAGLSADDLETVLADRKFNAEYRAYCNRWRKVQAILDDINGKSFECQKKGLAEIKRLID